jgi:hypothetical protein
MRDLERDARERAHGLVSKLLESADPILTLMPATVVVAAWKYGVAFDWLALKGRAGGGPVFEGASLEVEIQRLAVFIDGQDAFLSVGERDD